jgi:putative ABC transport system permease protein
MACNMALPLSYHWRSVFVRKTTSGLTVLVIAAVVATLGWLLGFGAALRGSLAVANDEHKLLVLRRGADSETSSALPVEDFNKLTQLGAIATDPTTSEPLISGEVLVQVLLPRLRDGGKTTANVAVRGVSEQAFRVHRAMHLEGQSFSTGGQEVIVGVKAASQFAGLKIGDLLRLGYSGQRDYKVVGYFTAAGGPLESEVWGYRPSIMSAYNRAAFSSASVLLRDDADPRQAIEQVEGPAIGLSAKTEPEYWAAQTKNIYAYIGIVSGLVIIMALAAVLCVANTMFATVAGRTREIAMLRTIGFSGRQILSGFVLEAVLLGLLGGVLGCLACAAWLALVSHTKDMVGRTNFVSLAFDIRMTPLTIAVTLLAVVIVGAGGALFPAWRAGRTEVVSALREN